MSERVYLRLIAVEIAADSERQASEMLVGFLATSQMLHPTTPFDSWWEADDERTDGNDCDSAVFCKQGYQAEARIIINLAGLGELD